MKRKERETVVKRPGWNLLNRLACVCQSTQHPRLFPELSSDSEAHSEHLMLLRAERSPFHFLDIFAGRLQLFPGHCC